MFSRKHCIFIVFFLAAALLFSTKNASASCAGNAVFSINTSPACKKDSVSFSNSSADSATYFIWIWGDGSKDSVSAKENIKHKYGSAGIFSVSLIWANGSCRDTATQSITVYDNPEIILGADTTVCVYASSFTLKPNISGGVWSGTGVSSNSFSAATAGTGSHILKYVYTNGNGCKDSATRKFIVSPKPTAAFSFNNDSACSGTQITFTNASTGGNSYLWKFSNGTTSTDANPQKTFDSEGNDYDSVQATLVVSNSNGCKDSISKMLYFKQRPDGTWEDYDFNYFTRCSYSALSPDYELSIENYSNTLYTDSFYTVDWGDSSTITIADALKDTLKHTYTSSGSFDLKITTTGKNGCTNTRTYRIFNGTNPAFGFSSLGSTEGCAPIPFTFPLDTVNIAKNSPSTNYTFQFDDGTSSFTYVHPPQTKISHTFTSTSCGMADQAYTLSGTASNPCGTTKATVSSIRISEKPDADFSISPKDTGCKGDILTFRSIGAKGKNIRWNPGTGSYVCDTVVDFNWTITPATGWSVSSGTLSRESVGIKFTKTGTYYIKLKVGHKGSGRQCGDDTLTKKVIIYEKPVADFSSTANKTDSCANKTFSYTNLSTGGNLKYKWIVTPNSGYVFSNPATDTSANPQITFGKAGQYIIALVASNLCGKDTARDTIIIKEKPVSTLPADKEYCGAKIISFSGGNINHKPTYNDNRATITGYNWVVSGTGGATFSGSTSASANPTIIFPDPGIYYVSVAATNSCGTSVRDTQKIVILPMPVADAGEDKFLCYGESVQIGGAPTASGGSGNYTYSWSPSSGLSAANVANPTANPTSSKQYILTLTDSLGCQSKDTVNVEVNNPLFADAGANQEICYGGSVQIGGTNTASGGSGTFTYTWWPKNALNDSTIAKPTANPLSTTLYYLKITDSKNCTAYDSAEVKVNPKIIADAGNDTRICFGDSAQIGGNSSGGTGTLSYSWTSSRGGIYTSAQKIYVSPDSTTSYYLSVKDGKNCVAKDTVVITVNPEVFADAGAERTICYGDSTVLGGTPSASGGISGYTYIWEPGLGLDDSTRANPKAKPSSTMKYILTVTDTNGCSDTQSVLVIVSPRIFAKAGNDATICFGDSIQIGGNSNGGTGTLTYSWISSPTGFTSVSAKQFVNPTTSTTYYLEISDTKGCKAYDSVQIIVNPEIIADAGKNDSICYGETITLGGDTAGNGGSGTLNYSWASVPSGFSSSAANPIATPLSTTKYILTVSDENACSDTASATIYVNPQLVADAGANQEICYGGSVQIGGTNTASGGSGTFTYTWWPKNALNDSTIAKPTANPLSTTMYYLKITDSKNCTAYDSVEVKVNPEIIADAGNDTRICFGDSAQIGGNSSGGTGTLSYSWTSSPTGFSSALAKPKVSPTQNTSYFLQIADAKNCMNFDTVFVEVLPEIIADAGSKQTICKGDSVQIGGNSGGGSGTLTYSWSPATTLSNANTAKPFAKPAATTKYTLTVSDTNNCIDTQSVTVVVNDLPSATISGNDTICKGESAKIIFQFTGKSPWKLSYYEGATLHTINNIIANSDTINISPGATTIYKLFSVSDANCTATLSDSIIIHVNPLPVADAGNNQTICAGDSVQIGAASISGHTYIWNPAVGLSNSGISNPYAKPSTSTTYYVTETINATGCSNTDSVRIVVNPLPDAFAGTADSICAGQSATLGKIATNGHIYSWTSNPSGFSDTTSNPTVNPSVTTTYYLTETDTLTGCAKTDSVKITLIPLPPTPVLSSNSPICVGETLNLNASNESGATYFWSGPNSFSSTSRNPAIINTTSANSGNYILVIKKGSCYSKADTINVVINDLPDPDAGADKTICERDSVQIGTVAAGYSYTWISIPSGFSSTAAEPFVKPSTTTTYIVRQKNNSTSCENTDTVLVKVNAKPTGSISGGTAICKDDSAMLSFALGGASPWEIKYTNGTDTFTKSNITNSPYKINVSPASTATYKLFFIADKNCSDTLNDSVNIIINPLPVADAGSNRFICFGDSVQIGGSPSADGGSGTFSYNWIPTTGLHAANIANPIAKPSTTTTYKLTVTDIKGCISYDSVTVEVNHELIADAGNDKFICYGSNTILGGNTASATGGNGLFTYSWSPKNALDDSTKANPTANPLTTTTYILTVTDGKNCVAFDTIKVEVNPELKAFAGNDKFICYGSSISIGADTAAKGGNGVFTYSWSPKNALNDSASANPVANPTSTTTYVLTVKDGKNCVAYDTVKVEVNPELIALAGTDKFVCFGDTTRIGSTNAGNGGKGTLRYKWTPKTGLNFDTIPFPVVDTNISTTYVLTVTDSMQCAVTDTVIVTVNSQLFADAGEDKSICFGDNTILGADTVATGGTSPYTYSWWPKNGLDDTTIANPTANPDTTITYFVTVTDNKNCSKTDTVNVKVNPQMFISAGADNEICAGDSTQIGGAPTASGGSGNYTYKWSPSAGLNNDTLANPKASPSSTTNYILKVTDPKGCIKNDTIKITVHPRPEASISGGTDICKGDSITLSIAFTGTQPWNFSYTNGIDTQIVTSLSSSPYTYVVKPDSTTTYTVIELSDNYCADSSGSNTTVIINPLPVADAGTDQFICFGDTVQVGGINTGSGGTGTLNYSWSSSAGSFSSGAANPKVSPGQTTIYYVAVTDAKGCKSYDSVEIEVNPELIADAGNDKFICYGSSTTIGADTAAKGGNGSFTYSWSPKNALDDSTKANPIANPLSTTTYILTVKDGKNCVAFDTIKVEVNPELKAFAGNDKFICYGSGTTIGADTPAIGGNGIFTYSWSPKNALNDTTISNPTANPLSTTTYILTVKDGKNCVAFDTIKVEVNPKLIANAGADKEICYLESANLGSLNTASGGKSGYTYLWQPGNSLDDSTIANPSAKPLSTTTYIVTITDSKNCIAKDTIKITVNSLPIVDAGDADTFCNTNNTTQFSGFSPAGGVWKGKGITSSGLLTPSSAGLGSHTYTYVYTDVKGCKDSASKTIYITNPPAIEAGKNDTFCVDYGNFTLSGYSPAGGVWSGKGVSPSGVFNTKTADTGAHILTYTFGSGTCEVKDTKIFYVNPLPIVFAGNDTDVCISVASFDLNNFSPKGGFWAGNGISDSVNATFVPSNAGLGNHQLIYSYTNPKTLCVNYDTVNIFVRPLPQAAFSSDSLYCRSVEMPFTNNSTGAETYFWRFGDGGNSTDENPKHIYASTGKYFVQLISTSKYGCNDTTSKTIRIAEIPTPKFALSVDSGCAPLEVNFTNQSSGEIYDYLWDFGNDSTTTQKNPGKIVYQPSLYSDTIYYVKLTVSNLCGSETYIDSVKVKPIPVADFFPHTNIGCSPLAITFHNQSKGAPTKYFWDLGNGKTSTRQFPPVQVYTTDTTDTTYTIRLVVHNDCGTDTMFQTVKVKPKDAFAVFKIDTTEGCVPLTVKLEDHSRKQDVNMSWNFGDGNISTDKNPTHTYTKPGTYKLRQYVNNGCSFDTTEVTIFAYPKAEVYFTQSHIKQCVGQKIKFFNGSKNVSDYVWDFGDGDTSHAEAPEHIYAQPGKYFVKLTSRSIGYKCVASYTDSIEILPLPDMAFSAPAFVGCQPFALTISKTPNADEFYKWDFGDGNTSVEDSPTHIYADTGTFTLTLTAVNINGCRDTITQTVKVLPIPQSSFTMSATSACDGPADVQLTNTSTNADAITWFWPDNQSSTINNPVAHFDTPGVYNIMLVSTNLFKCTDTFIQQYTIYHTPKADFSYSPAAGCNPLRVSFQNKSIFGIQYIWDFGDGDTSSFENPAHTYTKAGQYSVKLYAVAGNCSDTIIKSNIITVHPLPIAGFDYNIRTEPYFDGTIDFKTESQLAHHCFWYFGDGDSSLDCEPSHRYRAYGKYRVMQVVFTEFGCPDTFYRTIDVNLEKGLFVPNALTPNSGPNDVREFKPSGMGLKSYKLQIYNGYGELLWENDELVNGQPAKGWDGTYKGKPCPQDIYVWKIEAMFLDGSLWQGKDYGNGKKRKTGSLHLLY